VVDRRLREPRERAPPALARQQAGRRVGVVARRRRDVQDFLEGVAAGLPGLQLREVHHCALLVEYVVGVPVEDGDAIFDRTVGPLSLGLPDPCNGGLDVRLSARRNLGQRLASVRRFDRDSWPLARDDEVLAEAGERFGVRPLRVHTRSWEASLLTAGAGSHSRRATAAAASAATTAAPTSSPGTSVPVASPDVDGVRLDVGVLGFGVVDPVSSWS